MEKQRPPILAAYDLVIETVKLQHEKRTGKQHGAITWLAQRLGVSRQTVDNWSSRAGIPSDYVVKVAKATGLTHQQIRPDTLLVEVPSDVWQQEATERLIAHAITHPNQRRRHGTR